MLRMINLKTWMVLLVALGIVLTMPLLGLAGGHGHKKPAKKAILLVTFGTSVPSAQKVFKTVEAAYRKAFPGVEIRWAYTAKFIRDKLAKKGQVLLSPEVALAKLLDENYTQVAVQSLHVIPGAEFHDLLAVVHGFKDMDPNFRPLIGYPLCATTDDLQAVAAALVADLPKGRSPKQAVVFMGHGTPHPAGVVYPAMAYILKKKDPHIFLGTVEGYPTLEDVKEGLKAAKIKEAYLLPFMTVAGDHAHNDMAGPEPDSWKSVLEKAGIRCKPVLKSITENPNIVKIFIAHTKNVMKHFK